MFTTVFQHNAAETIDGGSQDNFPVGSLTSLEIDVTVTVNTGVLTLTYYRVDPYGNLYQVWQGSVPGTGSVTVDIGPGLTVPMNPGNMGQINWTLGGGSATFQLTVQGK